MKIFDRSSAWRVAARALVAGSFAIGVSLAAAVTKGAWPSSALTQDSVTDEVTSPVLRFGVIADCQYCALEGGHRRYSLSERKLRECVSYLNEQELDFVVHLGDFIDRDWSSFDVVGPIYDSLRCEKYHVLGNHDFSVEDERKAEVPARMGLSRRYYDFTKADCRFIVIDGNDLSFHAHPEGSAPWRRSATYHRLNAASKPKWNGALSLAQLTWLDETLADADAKGQRAFVLCHFPIFPADAHNLWNDAEVGRLLEQHESFVAYLNGHNHAGNHGVRDGRHYHTFHGMVDTETTAFSVVEVHADRLEIQGHGRQPSRSLPLRSRSER